MKKYNKDLKEITNILEIEVPLTSYVVRHIYATTLKRRLVEMSVFSEGLGHANVATTKAFLEKFDQEMLDEVDGLF